MENSTIVVLISIIIVVFALVVSRFMASKIKQSYPKQTPSETLITPDVDTSVDLMDPRGDGTVVPGDVMWDFFQKTMEGDGNVVIGNLQDDGSMKVEVYPMDEDEKRD